METPGGIKIGASLFVPNVQELAKQPLAEVPARYIRNDQDLMADVCAMSMIDQKVPVIDLQKLLSPAPIVGDLELERLHSACKEWGFFQVVNHGVDTLFVEKTKSEIQGFFDLPMDEKKKFWQLEGDMEGFGQVHVKTEDQKLDWGDMFFMLTLPRHMRKPRLFPKLPLRLRETIESYSLQLSKLSMTLLELMGKALGIEAKVMEELFGDGRQIIKMNYYPPCPQPENVLGNTPHSDATGLTILLQLNEVEGLQIRKDNMWVPVKPLPNAFIVNVGDLLQIMSNGIYSSVEHRVTVNTTKERLSVATFHCPQLSTEIGPIPGLITPETPALFRRIVYEDYIKKYFSRKLEGKSFLDYMRVGEGDEDTNPRV
ncbi:codeine O-demethylase-like [Papaver somniferum]|uniref:codeine O-demethylase-like n=1 Tax=Papaver somniferum TaxID=3469 RepID=UPI000E6FDD5C|nr:codeine O-demethylase-like [Papaver somniferum]